MSNPLTPSFRYGSNIPDGVVHQSVKTAVDNNTKSAVDLNQAIASLKGQITKLTKATTAGTTSTTSTTTTNIEVTGFAGLGTINNQSANTAYTVQDADNGTLLLFSDASPVGVSLNPAVTAPYFFFSQNWGAGLVTFTPTSGTINYIGNLGAASMALAKGYSAIIVFDGTNWWAETLPLVPQSVVAMAGTYLTGYNAATGLFSGSTIPYATDSTPGIVQPDDSTIGAGASGIIYTMVQAGAGAPGFAGPSQGNLFYFDSTVSPWHGYVWYGGNWNRFS